MFSLLLSVLCFPVQASEKLNVGVLGSWWLATLGASLTALLLPFVHTGPSTPIHFLTSSIHTNLLQSSASAALEVTVWIYKWSVTVAGIGTWSVLTGCIEECCCRWGLPKEGGIAGPQPTLWVEKPSTALTLVTLFISGLASPCLGVGVSITQSYGGHSLWWKSTYTDCLMEYFYSSLYFSHMAVRDVQRLKN